MELAVGFLVLLSLSQTALIAYLVFRKHSPRLKADASDLLDVLGDLRNHGYAILRIDPDTIFKRGVR